MRVRFVVAKAGRGVVAWRQTGCRRGDAFAVMRLGRTVCQARQRAAAWLFSRANTQAAKFESTWNREEVASRCMSCDQKPTPTDVRGEKVINSLRMEACSIEFSPVSPNVEMSTEAVECGFNFVEEFLGNCLQAGCPPHLDFGGLELKID